MDKVVRDGKVAVLYSPEFGAGWYTWNQRFPQCIFDPDIVAWVEGGKRGPLPNLNMKYDDFYTGGSKELKIAWLPEGQEFSIDEYDGFERIVLPSDVEWLTA